MNRCSRISLLVHGTFNHWITTLNDVALRWCMLGALDNAMKGPFSKELMIRDEEMNPPCDPGFEGAVEEEKVSLPNSFVKLICLEKKINSLLKWESRKGRGKKR